MAKYSRKDALKYAEAFAHKVCHDSRVATDKGYPKIPAGTPIADADKHVNWRGSEDDCAHFMSCVIGDTTGKLTVGSTTTTVRGGGLKLPSPFANAGVYGHTHVSNIYFFVLNHGAKIITPEFRTKSDPQTRDDIVTKLGPGDLLIYSKEEHIRKHAHSALIVRSSLIACHTKSRFEIDFTDVGIAFVTLIKMP
jgi:hypothetical protein